MRSLLSAIGSVIFVVGIIIGGVYGYIFLFSDAAPRMEDARREVFINTQSYVLGKIDQLSKMRREFESTTDLAVKRAIREEILISAGTVDNEKLPASLREWLRNLESSPVSVKEKYK